MGLQVFIPIWIKFVHGLASKCGHQFQGAVTYGVLNMRSEDSDRNIMSANPLLEKVQCILVDEPELHKWLSSGMVIFWC
jgi:hypothetical protein